MGASSRRRDSSGETLTTLWAEKQLGETKGVWGERGAPGATVPACRIAAAAAAMPRPSARRDGAGPPEKTPPPG
ncbi:unnamed protein product [Merluccius merluccius]